MRVPTKTPLLLLLAAPSLLEALEIYNQDRPRLEKRDAAPELLETKASNPYAAPPAPLAAAVAPDAAPLAAKPRESSTTTTTTTNTRYRGTEDAPVDGFDGKPHLGPFVDTTRDDVADKAAADGTKAKTVSLTSKSRPTDLNKWTQAGNQEWRLEEIPEKNDGVMNDDTRVGPKKGTDGTAGGISEREKKGAAAGTYNKPQEPKEAPPLPHSEEEFIVKQSGDDDSGRSGTRVVDSSRREDAKYGAGGYGIDLPEGLPEKIHKERGNGGEPPVGGTGSGTGSDKWLVDTMPYTEGQRPNPPKKPKADATTTTLGGGDIESWHEWVHSFVLSFTMILVSEIGDKTFLVAALMAMRHPRILVFSSAFAALVVMTVLSAVLGHAFPSILPKRLTTFAAAVLFLVFGARSLKEGLEMSPDTGVGEEMKEVEAELEEKEHNLARNRRRGSSGGGSPYTLESGRGRPEPSPPSSRSPSPSGRKRNSLAGLANLLGLVLSPAWVQTFIMTFLGEWGDRSQIATIAMAAGQDYWWVTLGAVSGHAICTGLAVIGGRALAGRVSMRVVTIGGAVAFLVFGVIYLFECITEKS